MDYWDASAILKLYVPEDDSPYFLQLITRSASALSSSIVAAEVICALHRRERAGDLKPGGANSIYLKFVADCDSGRIVIIPYDREVLAEAGKLIRLAYSQPRPIMIRAFDLIHLASAVTGRASTLVATDRRLREAAALASLKLLP